MSYKIELHLHTKGNSACAHVNYIDIIKEYKEKGYSGIVCTNHLNETAWSYLKGFTNKTKHKSFLKGFDDLYLEAKKNGIKVYFGMELALKGEDYKGLRENCVELLIYGIERKEFEIYSNSLYSMSHKEIFDLANEKGWVIIQSHPFRPRTRLENNYVHGAECINTHFKHKNNNNLAIEYVKNNNYIGTCGSDYHENGMAISYIEVETMPENEKSLAQMLKNNNFKLFEYKE